jgi:hypothetical protein
MNERKVKEIYKQLKDYFQNRPETPDFEQNFSKGIN